MRWLGSVVSPTLETVDVDVVQRHTAVDASPHLQSPGADEVVREPLPADDNLLSTVLSPFRAIVNAFRVVPAISDDDPLPASLIFGDSAEPQGGTDAGSADRARFPVPMPSSGLNAWQEADKQRRLQAALEVLVQRAGGSPSPALSRARAASASRDRDDPQLNPDISNDASGGSVSAGGDGNGDGDGSESFVHFVPPVQVELQHVKPRFKHLPSADNLMYAKPEKVRCKVQSECNCIVQCRSSCTRSAWARMHAPASAPASAHDARAYARMHSRAGSH